MSIHYKLIIPLLDKNIKLEDISKESGFVGIYKSDINRPWLDDHIFLLYKRSMNDQYLKTKEKLSKSPNLYGKWNIKIKGVLYILFCFIRTRTISFIMKNLFSFISKEEEFQIGKFWLFTDDAITNFIMSNTHIKEEIDDFYVPEEDFSPKDFITYDEKRGALVCSVPL